LRNFYRLPARKELTSLFDWLLVSDDYREAAAIRKDAVWVCA